MPRARYGLMFRRSNKHRICGVATVAAGGLIIIKVLPLWIWPFGIGLWLLWAGLGPIVVGGVLIWLGWRLLAD